MAKLFLILAVAALSASAAPQFPSIFSLPFVGPKMGLEIGRNVVGGVKTGLTDNGFGMFATPLGAVESGLNSGAGMVGKVQETASNFKLPSLPSFGGLGGEGGLFGNSNPLSGLTSGFGSFMELPQKVMTQAMEIPKQVMGNAQGIMGQAMEIPKQVMGNAQGIMGGFTGELEGLLANGVPKEQIMNLVNDSAAKVQGQVDGALAKIQGDYTSKATQMAQTMVADLQKKAAGLTDQAQIDELKTKAEAIVQDTKNMITKVQAAANPEQVQKLAAEFQAKMAQQAQAAAGAAAEAKAAVEAKVAAAGEAAAEAGAGAGVAIAL